MDQNNTQNQNSTPATGENAVSQEVQALDVNPNPSLSGTDAPAAPVSGDSTSTPPTDTTPISTDPAPASDAGIQAPVNPVVDAHGSSTDSAPLGGEAPAAPESTPASESSAPADTTTQSPAPDSTAPAADTTAPVDPMASIPGVPTFTQSPTTPESTPPADTTAASAAPATGAPVEEMHADAPHHGSNKAIILGVVVFVLLLISGIVAMSLMKPSTQQTAVNTIQPTPIISPIQAPAETAEVTPTDEVGDVTSDLDSLNEDVQEL